ncbi:hypothetical protein MMC06_003561 [Schaereria dolodes]|nr:hypothetical protein [Schaereria dolodes]
MSTSAESFPLEGVMYLILSSFVFALLNVAASLSTPLIPSTFSILLTSSATLNAPSTIPSVSPASSPVAAPPFKAWCFEEQQHMEGGLSEIQGSDCLKAIEIMFHGDKANAPMLFSRTRGFMIPHDWSFGTCVIAIDMRRPDGEETFPMSEIGSSVEAIVEECAADPNEKYRWGGRGFAGPENAVKVFVIGQDVKGPNDPVLRPEDFDTFQHDWNVWVAQVSAMGYTGFHQELGLPTPSSTSNVRPYDLPTAFPWMNPRVVPRQTPATTPSN